MYGKLINNRIEYAPINYETDEHVIINFNQSEELMKEHGFKEVIDKKPEYDYDTHRIVVNGYEENENNIIINYSIKELEQTNKEFTLEDKILALEKTNKEQYELINITLSTLENMYAMLEPIIANTLVNSKSLNPLINMYVVMIDKQIIETIEQVPEKYRQQVEEAINKSNSI